jgi:ferrochelatase
MPARYDALLLVSFGGPERSEDVVPFLRRVIRGRDVPEERVREVAAHYQHFGGRSPLNDHCRTLLAAVRAELDRKGPRLPVYWGNRNWHPFLVDTLRAMAEAGVRRALAFVTSAFGSYSGCRQYLEDIAQARSQLGPDAPEVDKLRGFHNHPGFVSALVDNVVAALERVPAARRRACRLVFTAHSIPCAMAASSPYHSQLRETASLVAARLDRTEHVLAFQSRSGPQQQPWLEPDILDVLDTVAREGARDVVLVPLGFVSDHMEVVYDLDLVAQARAAQLGLHLVRAATVGSHPRFVRMVRELVVERISGTSDRPYLGTGGAAPDVCPAGCCRPPRRKPPLA